MSGDLLDSSRPKRLVLEQGRWCLEMCGFVSTGDGVFRPRTLRIEGRGAIVEALRRSRMGSVLVEQTARIMDDREATADAPFKAIGSSWVPSAAFPSLPKGLGVRDCASAAEAALLAEVTLLRAGQQGLLARVARLERMVSLGLAAPARQDVAAGARPVTPPGESRAGSSSKPPLGKTRSVQAGRGPKEAVASGKVAPEKTKEPESEIGDGNAALELPGIGVLATMLKQLCGKEVVLHEAKNAGVPWQNAPLPYFASWLIDDAGAKVGAILCDTVLVCRLGGALLMLPPTEIESQIKSGSPTDDALSAGSEICNNLSGALNHVPGNPHVRATALERLEGAPPEWLGAPRRKLVCNHPEGGVLAVVSATSAITPRSPTSTESV